VDAEIELVKKMLDTLTQMSDYANLVEDAGAGMILL
jgi:hypothetical protein